MLIKQLSLLCLLVHISLAPCTWAIAAAPADHLLPPPLPTPQRLTHARAPFLAAQSSPAETRPIPVHQFQQQNTEAPGLMTRIARWFGFANSQANSVGPGQTAAVDSTAAGSQQVQTQYKLAPNKGNYYYQKPNLQQQQHPQLHHPNHPQQQPVPQQKPCSQNCNNFPWVPMFAGNPSYAIKDNKNWPLQQQEAQPSQYQLQYKQQPSQIPQQYPQQANVILEPQKLQPLRQRAVQFNFPKLQQLPLSPQQQQQYVQHLPLVPLTLFQPQHHATSSTTQRPNFIQNYVTAPELSGTPQPPIHQAQNFHPTPANDFEEQQLPSTETAHFAENVGAHSELRPAQIAVPTQIPPTTAQQPEVSSIEIIRSHQLTDFVQSIEYPATYVKSHNVDVDYTPMPENHKPASETPTAQTVNYQHNNFDPSLSRHVPASELLTQPGNFATVQKPTTTESPTTFYYQQHTDIGGYYDNSAPADNYPAASSLNISAASHDAWNGITSDLYYSTPQPFFEYETTSLPVQQTEQPPNDFVTERLQELSNEFVPSFGPTPPATSYHVQEQHFERDTPKRLLDSPIQHQQSHSSGHARPFTRDPSSLQLREQTIAPRDKQKERPLVYVTPPPQATERNFDTSIGTTPEPTPTSTYGAIDASGQYAGMAPPPAVPPALPLPLVPGRNINQIVIPYTTKNRPRPFQSTHSIEPTTQAQTHSPQQNEIDTHEQQESKVVTASTVPPANTRRTTKYLTKILASNLRELLKREHEIKNKSRPYGFDLSKLQRNIDGWTEQEYSSLSHRPSTPTIRGRSKHIPTEYLTTTTAMPPTTSNDAADLSTSINNLETRQRNSDQLLQRGKKRFKYVPIDDNSLQELYDLALASRRLPMPSTTEPTTTTTTRRTSSPRTTTIITTTTTTPRPTSTTTRAPVSSSTILPYFLRALSTEEPARLWQKARVSISPQTQEKIYVVTPQPRFFPQRGLSFTTDSPILSDSRSMKAAKLAAAKGNNNERDSSISETRDFKSTAFFDHEVFGLMNLSAYVPERPVEIIDGNSKVVTIVTPASKPGAAMMASAKGVQGKRIESTTAKPTMSPSPR